jgi:hypothetical protein
MADGDEMSGTSGGSQGDAAVSQYWRLSFDGSPPDFDLIGEAIKLRQSPTDTPKDKKEATDYLKEVIARRLLAAGFRHDQINLIEDEISARVAVISSAIDVVSTMTPTNYSIIEPLIANFIEDFPRLYSNWMANQKAKSSDLFGHIEEIFELLLDDYGKLDVRLPHLRQSLKDLLAARLCDTGLSEPLAAKIARRAVRDFQASLGDNISVFPHPRAAELAARLAASVSKATRETPTESFRAKAKNPLPEKAYALWERVEDRLPDETPIAFLKRVWRPWLEEDIPVLFQDDIYRLGDKKLVRAIRNYCHRRGMKAAEYLPPPQRLRIDLALEAAEPGSAQAEILKSRVRSRESQARRRRAALG